MPLKISRLTQAQHQCTHNLPPGSHHTTSPTTCKTPILPYWYPHAIKHKPCQHKVCNKHHHAYTKVNTPTFVQHTYTPPHKQQSKLHTKQYTHPTLCVCGGGKGGIISKNILALLSKTHVGMRMPKLIHFYTSLSYHIKLHLLEFKEISKKLKMNEIFEK